MNDDPVARIRPFFRTDVPAVAAIENECFGIRAWSDESLHMVPLLHGPFAFVAETGGTLAGYAFGAIVADAVTQAWLVSVAVRQSYGKRGIGTRLVTAVAESLRTHGVRTLRLTVSPDSPAIRFYERLGCRAEGFEPDFFGPGHARRILVLPLE